MRVFNCASQESFRAFHRCLTSLMQIEFWQAKNDYFSDVYEVVPKANVHKTFVCFALAANGTPAGACNQLHNAPSGDVEKKLMTSEMSLSSFCIDIKEISILSRASWKAFRDRPREI